MSYRNKYILKDVVDFVTEKTKTSNLNEFNYISTENMQPNLGGITKSPKLPGSKNVNAFLRNDTLFSNIRTYFRKVWLARFGGGASADVLIFRTRDENILHPHFLYYLISNQDFIDYSDLTSKGAKMPRGDKSALAQYEFSLPNIEDQKKISILLKSLDNLIEANNKINQIHEEIAQAIFKSWFIDFDPVKAKIKVLESGGTPEEAEIAAMCKISGKSEVELQEFKKNRPDEFAELTHTASLFPTEMEESELGEIPLGWEIKSLDEIAHFQNGLALQKFRPEGDEFLPVLKIAELKKGNTIGSEKASPNIKPQCIVENGDVIFSWSGSLHVDIWSGGKAALNQHLFKVTSETYPKWLYYFYTKHHLCEFIKIAQDKAVTMGHIKREHLSYAKCALPKNSELLKANSIIELLIEKKVSLSLENITLTNIRDSILPKLLSGEIQIQN